MSLSLSEKYQLLNKYKTELRLLEFQIERVKETIADIEADIQNSNPKKKSKEADSTENHTTEKNASISENRDKDTLSTVISKKPKPVMKAINVQKLGNGYKLSDWDSTVIKILEDFQKIMLQLEIRERIFDNESLTKGLTDEQVLGKLNRSLQKLVNKRGIMVKIPYIGKGYFYGLKEWLDRDGEMPNVRLRKEY